MVTSLMEYENCSLYENRKCNLQLYDRDIELAKERNAKSEMTGWMLIKYEIMIRTFENPEFPIDKIRLNEEILDLESELKTLIK